MDASEYGVVIWTGASVLENHDVIHSWLYDGGKMHLCPKTEGEGVHHKLKKSEKLALSKTRCASAAAKASGDTIPTGLMQNAGDLYKEMMGDATGDYLNKSLRKLTLGQLEELNAKMEEMALNERTCKKLCGNIFPLYAELVNVKDRVGGVLEALDEAVHYQLTQTFYSDAKARFNITLPDVVGAVISSEKEGAMTDCAETSSTVQRA